MSYSSNRLVARNPGSLRYRRETGEKANTRVYREGADDHTISRANLKIRTTTSSARCLPSGTQKKG